MNALLIHGMFSRAGIWDKWIPELASRGILARAIDLPGHDLAANDVSVRGLGLRDYVEAVKRHAAGPDTVLIGHSMGGLLVQQLLGSVECRAAVLVASAMPNTVRTVGRMAGAKLWRPFLDPRLYWRSYRLSRADADHFLFNRVPGSDRSALYAALVAESGKAFCQVAGGEYNLARSNWGSRVTGQPVILSLTGSEDRLVPAAAGRALALRYGRQMIHRELPGHGHWIVGEPGWRGVVEEIATWLLQQSRQTGDG